VGTACAGQATSRPFFALIDGAEVGSTSYKVVPIPSILVMPRKEEVR
jgi:hypothetical protein